MIKSGLVSVTFRKLSPAQIIELVQRAQLDAIEWGGDIHVPHGDFSIARAVRKQMEAAQLISIAYGSYYRAGHSEEEGLSFQSVLETARALNAPSIRIWAGARGSHEANAPYRRCVADDILRVCEMAQAHSIEILLEFHANTLTDNAASAMQLMNESDCENLLLYWQPSIALSPEQRLQELRAVLPKLKRLHVFHWAENARGERERKALREGVNDWSKYLQALRGFAVDAALLEFVRDDDPTQFLQDAATLREQLTSISL